MAFCQIAQPRILALILAFPIREAAIEAIDDTLNYVYTFAVQIIGQTKIVFASGARASKGEPAGHIDYPNHCFLVT